MARTIGFGLIALSLVLNGGLLLVPFLPLAVEQKVGLAAGLAVAGEGSFWGGGLLVGREVMRKYRRWLDPRTWRRRRSEPTE